MRFVRRLWCAPLLLVHRACPVRPAVDRDVRRMVQPDHTRPLPGSIGPLDVLDALGHPQLRSVFYARLVNAGGPWRILQGMLRRVWPGQTALEISCPRIGGGLYMLHGFATIVVAESIGEDCLIAQQVTVGHAGEGEVPVIGDRVRIGAGAKVFGRIHVGDDASIGANAVVIRDVPAGAVVGGVPARILSSSPPLSRPAEAP